MRARRWFGLVEVELEDGVGIVEAPPVMQVIPFADGIS